MRERLNFPSPKEKYSIRKYYGDCKNYQENRENKKRLPFLHLVLQISLPLVSQSVEGSRTVEYAAPIAIRPDDGSA